MNEQLKNIIIGIIFAIGCVGLYLYCEVKTTLQNPITPKVTELVKTRTAADITTGLAQQEEQLWQEFKQWGVDKKTTNAVFEQMQDRYRQDVQGMMQAYSTQKKLTARSYELVKSVCADFNFPFSKIKLVAIRANNPAGANDTYMMINEDKLFALPEKAQKFVIAHELQHIIHSDDTTFFGLEMQLSTKPNGSTMLNKYSRFMETRADTCAALCSPEYAQGQIAFFEYMLEHYGENKEITHPKKEDRVAFGKDILATHKAIII